MNETPDRIIEICACEVCRNKVAPRVDFEAPTGWYELIGPIEGGSASYIYFVCPDCAELILRRSWIEQN